MDKTGGAAEEVNKNVAILLIGVFADDYLTDIAAKRIKDTGYKTIHKLTRSNLANVLTDGVGLIATIFQKWKGNSGQVNILPLFVREERGDGKDCGLKCPYEFIIERKDLLDSGKYNAVKALGERIGIVLELLKRASSADEDVGVKFNDFKDWMAGVMRRYLFLDDTAHGSSGYIDPEDKNWNWDKDDYKYRWVEEDVEDKKTDHGYANHGQWLKDRFSSDAKANKNDPSGWQKPLMRKLWEEYFGDKELSLEVLSANTKTTASKIIRMEKVYKPDSLPLSHGDRTRFVTPTGKLNVLLIDDNADKADIRKAITTPNPLTDWPKGLAPYDAKHKVQWDLFRRVFRIHPLQIDKSNFADTENLLRDLLRLHLSFDFALVDLCLGEESGQDLLGYHVIKKVAKLFPHMPIIVYSRFHDMGHIMRAFQCGAMWFLQKGEEQKLARHLMDVVKKGIWKREWRAMQDYSPVEFIYNGKDLAFDDKFRHTEEWQYLTAKSLEFFPGKFIEVKKMGGGISTASTFSVQKGLKLDGNPLQSPMIIKIDTAPNTLMEFQRYFRYVRPYMANEAGRIEKPCIIIGRNCSAIVYTFAGRQDKAHALDSMKNMLKEDIVFKASCDYEKYRKAFDMIFDEILPKIHRVTPNREFGDGEENRHQEVFSKPEALDAKDSKGASFPNLQFGEVAKEDFYQTYLIRYPHFGKKDLTNAQFVNQPTFKIEEDGIKLECSNLDAHPYEFHDIWKNDDGSIDLEVYDCKDDRKPYLLTGPIATHVAKFRQQMYPGSILWVSGEVKVECAEQGELRMCMFVERVEEDENWVKYANECSAEDASKSECSGMKYFGLVDKVLLFCKALYGTIADNELEGFLWSDKNSESTNETGELNNGQPDKKSEPLFNIDEAKKFFEHIRDRFKCPIAICHGDLNYGNIMLESRKHPPKDEKPDVSQTITDAWLIDFARTRRDMIAHDFNVMFTDTFALLFDERLFKDAELNYDVRLTEILPRFIRDVMFAKNPNPPDYLNGDARFEFIYKILRRIRKAALDSGISEEMYTLTTVLECLMALKLHLKNGMKNIRASAALFAVAKICFEKLCDDVELDLLSMDKDGKTNKQRLDRS